jgi:hypothetical protein
VNITISSLRAKRGNLGSITATLDCRVAALLAMTNLFVSSCEIILAHEGKKAQRRGGCTADVLRLLGHNMLLVGMGEQ